MHVGVIAPNFGEQTGGAYTLENDLFDAIFSEASLSPRHHFTAVADARATPIGLKKGAGDGFLRKSNRVVRAAVERMGAKRIFRKGYRALRGAAQTMGVVKPEQAVAPSQDWSCWVAQSVAQVDDVVARNGIEFVISLNPKMYCTRQPYLIYVWDLEHRKAPFFPEVRGVEWHRREKHFNEVLGKAAFVITGTRVGAAEVERFFGVSPERLRVIPFPTPQFALEPPRADELEEPLPQFPLGATFLFYPAQFWAHKNHVTALKVLKELRDYHRLNIKLVFVGSDQGNLAHVEDWTRRLQLESEVVYAGFVTRPQLRWLYRNALALLFPTLFGPDNLPPLEAFALGCPVIASAIDGASEQLGDAAVLCNPLDVKSYANAGAMMCKDAFFRADLIKRGQARAAQWTRRDAAKALLRLLDEFALVRDNWSA